MKVYSVIQKTFFKVNGIEYQMTTDVPSDLRVCAAESTAENILYDIEKKMLKAGYHVQVCDHIDRTNGIRMRIRLEHSSLPVKVLELHEIKLF